MHRDYVVVDTDIHPIPPMERTLDFLLETRHIRVAGGNQGPGGAGYWNPTGVIRADAVAPDDTRIETDPVALSKHFFDSWGRSIVLPKPSLDFMLAFSTLLCNRFVQYVILMIYKRGGWVSGSSALEYVKKRIAFQQADRRSVFVFESIWRCHASDY